MFESLFLQSVANKASPADAMSCGTMSGSLNLNQFLISYPGHAMHQGNMDMEEVLLGSMVTHLRLAGRCAVHFTEQTPLCLKKETFQANEGNKQRFLTC